LRECVLPHSQLPGLHIRLEKCTRTKVAAMMDSGSVSDDCLRAPRWAKIRQMKAGS